MQNTLSCSSPRFATHDPFLQTMRLAGVFEFAKNSWQEVESRSTLSIAGHPQGARWLPCCHRAACASEASWPRVTAMEADAGGAGWEACQMDCIPPSASVLFSSTFQPRPAPCFHQHSTFSQRLVFISISPSASVLFSSTSNPRPAPCFQCPQKNKKRC